MPREFQFGIPTSSIDEKMDNRAVDYLTTLCVFFLGMHN